MSIYHAASKAGLLLLNLVVVAIGVALVGVGWFILHGAPYAQKFAEALKQEYSTSGFELSSRRSVHRRSVHVLHTALHMFTRFLVLFTAHSSGRLPAAALESREDRRGDGHLETGAAHRAVRRLVRSGRREPRGGRSSGRVRGALLLPRAAHARRAARVRGAERRRPVPVGGACVVAQRSERAARALHRGGPRAHHSHAVHGPVPDPRRHDGERRTTEPHRCCVEHRDDQLTMYVAHWMYSLFRAVQSASHRCLLNLWNFNMDV